MILIRKCISLQFSDTVSLSNIYVDVKRCSVLVAKRLYGCCNLLTTVNIHIQCMYTLVETENSMSSTLYM